MLPLTALDGLPLRALNVRWLRQQIGLVMQEPVLFNTSLAQTIAYSKPGASQFEVERAARMANGGDDVARTRGSYGSTYGFGRLNAINSTHLRYSFEPLVPPPDNGTLRDDWWIVKS